MKTYTIESAMENFEELMQQAQQGLYVTIIGTDKREYRLMLEPLPPNKPRKPGSLKGKIKIADDFDEPLPEFKPYME